MNKREQAVEKWRKKNKVLAQRELLRKIGYRDKSVKDLDILRKGFENEVKAFQERFIYVKEEEFIPEFLATELKDTEFPPVAIFSRTPPNEKTKADIGQIWITKDHFFKCVEHYARDPECPNLTMEYRWERLTTARDAGKVITEFPSQ